MEQKFSILRKHLDELGYHQTLSYDSVPLVEQLLGDLVKTTESLFHYKNVAQTVIEERDQLQLGAEPYKCDNAKLVQECNDLHLAFIQFKEQTDKLQRDLKHQIENLEKENQELNRTVDKLRRTSDRASSGYSTRRTIPSKTTSVVTKSSKSEKHICTSEKMGTKEEIQSLKQENCRLKSNLIKQLELAECLSEKLDTRDEEIKRLAGLLEGGRPIEAINADCCFKEVSAKLAKMSQENCKLKCSKEDLELQLAEAIRKQHEAMKRALMLAERNKELERELQDIDQMALAVEAECNCKVKENIDKVAKCEEDLCFAYQKIEMLEREICNYKRNCGLLDTDYTNSKEEKENLQRILETALDDKRRMTNRMNQFQKIEHDLNHEMDKLAKTCTCQKRKIAELESQLAEKKLNGEKADKNVSTCKCKGAKDKKSGDHSPEKKQPKGSSSPGKQSRGSSPGKQSRGSSPGKQSRGSSPVKQSRGPSPGKRAKEPAANQDDQNKSFIEKLTKERNEFQEKCKTLQEQLEKINSNQKIGKTSSPSKMQGGDTLKRNLKEKDDKISKLEKNIQNLTREKHELITKLEDTKKWGDDKGTTQKLSHSKAEKERDMARGDCKKLEEERDSLRQRLKQVTEAQNAETQKLQKLVTETEKKLRQLENERQELVTVQGNRRATINNLEEKVETLSSQLRTTQSELDHLQTLHSQLKILHEQTDQALAHSQGQLNDIEGEYAKACNKIRDFEKNQVDLECQCSKMKQDFDVMRMKLTSIDAERDQLLIEIDNKTERIATLEMELNTRHNKMMMLEKMVTELQQKLSSYTDELTTKEYLLKTNSTEINTVRRTLDEAMKDKTSAVIENKRLQEDFAKVTYECKCANSELDRAKREIDDLKTQLQQYVFEIKRAEDLISKKEIERTEMLDQFRNLSEETTVLETNNHTLESQAIEVRNQLSTATNHIHDLESRVDQLNTLNKDYERQIGQMTKQIASLETQVRQSGTINRNVETEIADMKCLCVKLDDQKETLKKEVRQREDYTHQLELEKDHLRTEVNKLQDALHKETSNIGSLENLLATCRQETVEQRLLNQELQGEIHRLKNMVQELQNKLKRLSSNATNGRTNTNSNDLKYVCIDMEEEREQERERDRDRNQHQSTTPQYSIRLYENQNHNENERKRHCCDLKTCPKRKQFDEFLDDEKILNKIPEKTIYDEVCLHKTLYCSGTQQNLHAYPEQRNVGIQQIFRSHPEYVERTSEQGVVYRPCPETGDDINEVPLRRFSMQPENPRTKSHQRQEYYNRTGEKYKTICVCIPLEKTDSNENQADYIMPETQNAPNFCNCKCSVCSKRVGTTETNENANYIYESKRNVCSDDTASPVSPTSPGTKKCPFTIPETSTATYRKQSSNKPEKSRSTLKKSVPTIEEDKIIENVKTFVCPKTSSKKSEFRRDAGPVEDKDGFPDEKERGRIYIHKSIPYSEPTIRKKSKVPVYCNYQSKLPIDHKSAKEKEEDPLGSRCRRTQQQSCLLSKSMNLDDNCMHLLYQTDDSRARLPFRSKSSERHHDKNDKNDKNINTNTNNNDSNTIIVIPETCKQNIVDSPKSVTFSCNTRCKTIEDIDAKCKELLKLNLTDADHLDY